MIFQILTISLPPAASAWEGSIATLTVEDDAPRPPSCGEAAGNDSRRHHGRPIAANGYRFAKWQGKPNVAFRRKAPLNLHFCDLAVMAVRQRSLPIHPDI